jgi:hypothetical protein
MGMGMKVSNCMIILPINLVCERSIRNMRDKNIQKGERVNFFHFHSKLDMREMLLRRLRK